jgi:hypothetical protein
LLKASYCIDKSSVLDFISLVGDTPSKWLDIFVEKCDNKTSLVTCQSKETIDKATADLIISPTIIESFTDSTDFENPGKIVTYLSGLPISSTMYKRHYIYYDRVKFNSDSGYIFEDIQSTEYLSFQRLYTDINFAGASLRPNSFGEITFQFNKIQKIFNRRYLKVQEVLASVGGFLNALYIIANLINFFIARKLYFAELFDNNFYDLVEEENPDQNLNENQNHGNKMITDKNELSNIELVPEKKQNMNNSNRKRSSNENLDIEIKSVNECIKNKENLNLIKFIQKPDKSENKNQNNNYGIVVQQ